ncbi:hypothetical protein KDM41_10595 [bacterium]|nr:hypothetical protein [bacterium]
MKGGVRRLALDILVDVADGADGDERLEQGLALAAPRDGALLAELVRGSLQWQARYDHVIASFSRKRPPGDPVLTALLRLSLHQLLALDGVPPYAAIHEAGELARARAGRGKVGFVNGLLQAARRRLRPDGADAAAREAALRELFAPLEPDRPRWLATWHSLPQWLVTRWRDRWGDAVAERLCAATNTPPPVHLHVLGGDDPAAVAAAVVAAGGRAAVGPGDTAVTLDGRPGRSAVREILASRPGLVVQDATVQEASAWLTAGDLVGPWLDLCAAPGGKAAHLAHVLPTTAPLVVMDRRPARMALLRDTLDRAAPGRTLAVQADGLHPPFAPAVFGGILLDGPCSGTGVLRHHPDGRWRLRPSTPARKARTLLALADRAAELLRPGGRLLYATCSLEAEENEDVLGALRERRPELVPDPAADGAWMRTWLPGDAGTPPGGDGFFAARLRRRTDTEGTENEA